MPAAVLGVAAFSACEGRIGRAAISPTETAAVDRPAWPLRWTGEASALRRLSRDELVATLQALTGATINRASLNADPRQTRGQLLTGGMFYVAPEIAGLDATMSSSRCRAPSRVGT